MAQTFNEDGGKYEVYCDVKTYRSLIYITINNKSYDITDKDGKKVETKEITETLNFLSKRGWKLVSVWGVDTNSYVHYIMKKDISDDKEIEIGLTAGK